MNLKTLKPTLYKLHRWIGVGLAPLFLLIALSGAVLAFKPITQGPPQAPATTASPAELSAFLQQLDPLGQDVQALVIDNATGQVAVRSRDPALAGRFDLASATRLENASEGESFDLFEFTERLHKGLLVGADLPVQLAAYLMLFLVLSALLLSWPRLRNNLNGWHRGIGWFLLPVVLTLPLTGVLMSLHLGMPELPRMSQPGVSLTLEEGLKLAQQAQRFDGVNMVRRFKRGSVLLATHRAGEAQTLVVTDQAVASIKPQDNLVKILHEGTWAGPWSGVINLLGGIALSLLGLTGFISWWRRRRKQRLNRSRQSAAEATI